MTFYATRFILALWEEVGLELVLLAFFCLGFSILRTCRWPSGNLKKMSMAVYENSSKQWGRRPTQPEDQLQRAQELLNAGKGDKALLVLTASPSSPLPGSVLVALFEALWQKGKSQQLAALPRGAIQARNLLVLAQHTASNPAMVREVHNLALSMTMTSAICEALLKAYCISGDTTPEAVDSLLKWMPSDATILAALGLCAQSQSVRLAERLASYSKQKKGVTLPVLASLLKVYSQAKLWEKACGIYKELKNADVVVDTATYGALIKAAVEAGRHQLAEELFQESKNPDAMNVMSMIRAAGRSGDVQKALDLLRQLELGERQLDTTSYNCALEACVAGGDRRRAEALLQQMVDVGRVDVVSYNTYMKLLHWPEEVHKTLQEMRKQGIEPNVVTYNSIIKETAARNIDSAWNVVEEMQREGVQPDAYTASILGAGLRRQPSKAGLERVLLLTSQLQPDEVLVNCLLDICIRLKDPSRLRQVLRWRADLPAPSAHACVMLIRAHGHAQQMDEAWQIWRQLLCDEKSLTEDIFMSMVDACLAAGDMKSLVEVFQEVKCWLPGFPRATVGFSLAVKMAMQLQKVDLALKLYDDTKEAIKLSLVTYNTLIDALVQSGSLNRAMELFHDMARDVGPDLITFSILVKGFASAGDLETAIILLSQMRRLNIQPDSILFNTILNGCAKRQMRALTEQVLVEMEKAGVAPSNFTLSILIKLYGRCGDLRAAFRVVEEYPKRFDFRLNAQVYTCLMSTCIWSGDLPMAFEVYKTMLQDGCLADGKTLETLLKGCLKHQDPQKAVEVMTEASELGIFITRETLEMAVLMVDRAFPHTEMRRKMANLGSSREGQSCRPRGPKKRGSNYGA